MEYETKMRKKAQKGKGRQEKVQIIKTKKRNKGQRETELFFEIMNESQKE